MSLLGQKLSTLARFALLTGVLVPACAVAPVDEVDAVESGAVARSFDQNNVVDDATLADATPAGLDAVRVQKFLEETPFRSWYFAHTRSPLAGYREGGQLASEIVAAVARKHGINPLELLVALEAEQSLISATELHEQNVHLAFRCGCPDGEECRAEPDAFIGFTKQAECYAGTLRRALEDQKRGGTTKNGWRRGFARTTDDRPKKIVVTPQNMATAALYDYTPVVGATGGGDPSLGGVSRHWELLQRFAKAVGYEGPPSSNDVCNKPGACAEGARGAVCSTSAECSRATPACDTAIGRCVPCAGDHSETGTSPRACPDPDRPTCASDGSCVECGASNARVCAKSSTRPACVVAKNTCGCTIDTECGPGRVCNPALGPAAMCVVGCRLAGGVDTCAPGWRCSVTDGSIGACKPISCAGTTCASPLVCDVSESPPRCVECLSDKACGPQKLCEVSTHQCVECAAGQTSLCSAKAAGAVCLANRCGCTVDAHCGGDGRTCDTTTHTCKDDASGAVGASDAGPPSAAQGDARGERDERDERDDPSAPQEPPSGHTSEDFDASPRAIPQFSGTSPAREGGCSTSAGGTAAADALGRGLMGLALALAAAVRRGRRGPSSGRER